MKTLLHSHSHCAASSSSSSQHQRQHSQHDTELDCGLSDRRSGEAGGDAGRLSVEKRQYEGEQSDEEEESDADKENNGEEAVSATRAAGKEGSPRPLDTTSEERPSTADSETERRSERRVGGGLKRATAAHWQRVVLALNEENDELRASLESERAAAAALAGSVRDRSSAELDRQARRYEAIIQEKDDEIGQLRSLIQSMNETMLNNTQQLIDAQVELHASHAPRYSDEANEQQQQDEQRTDGRGDDETELSDYPTLTPGSSPLLSPNKLAVLLDDTQDIITFDCSKQQQSAHKPPLPPVSPVRSACSRRTAALLPSFAVGSIGSPLKSAGPVAVAAAADANQLSAAWQRYLHVNHVERERQLAQLPLTSPSTPDSKRRKLASASPQAAASAGSKQSHTRPASPHSKPPSAAVGLSNSGSHSRSHTALSGHLNGAVKQLVFAPPHEQQQSVAAAAHRRSESSTVLEMRPTTATPAHSDTALRTQSRFPASAVEQAKGAASGAAAAAAADGEEADSVSSQTVARLSADSAAAAATAGESAEDEESAATVLSASDARRLSAELRRHRALLDVKNEWSVRMKAMSGIELLSRETGIGRWSEWSRELEALRPLLCDQLTDLRSAVVREACRLLVALASAGRGQFEREVDVYYPLLFKGLFVTIRVIRDSCDECLQALTQRTASVRCLPALLLGCCDPHAVVRDKCASYINTLIAAAAAASAADLAQLEPQAADIGASIGRLVQDSDHSTRAAARQLYRTFNKHFPSRAALVHAHFPSQVQKALDTERRAAAAASGAQGTKKKK